MTTEKPDPAALLPCPFCGSPPERFTIEDEMEVANVGGDVIACTKCQCSTRVFFGEKIGIEDAWNTRAALRPPEPSPDDAAVLDEYARCVSMIAHAKSGNERENHKRSAREARAAVLSRMGADRKAVIEEFARVAAKFPARIHGALAVDPFAAAEQAANEIASAIRSEGVT